MYVYSSIIGNLFTKHMPTLLKHPLKGEWSGSSMDKKGSGNYQFQHCIRQERKWFRNTTNFKGNTALDKSSARVTNCSFDIWLFQAWQHVKLNSLYAWYIQHWPPSVGWSIKLVYQHIPNGSHYSILASMLSYWPWYGFDFALWQIGKKIKQPPGRLSLNWMLSERWLIFTNMVARPICPVSLKHTKKTTIYLNAWIFVILLLRFVSVFLAWWCDLPRVMSNWCITLVQRP